MQACSSGASLFLECKPAPRVQACSSRASLLLACKPVPRVQACSSGASLLLGCKPVPRVKLSNMADLKALAKEFAALLGDDQTFIEIYKRATSEKFGFLYITMGSANKLFSSYKSEFRLKARSEEK